MKLSDIKGERSFDVIADIIDPIYNISQDEDAKKLFQRQTLPKGVSEKRFGADWLMKVSKAILKKHKNDCITILASIEGVSKKKYTENLDFVKLLTDVADLLSDEAFRALFFSTTQSGDTSSGSVSENTEDQKA